MERKSAQEFLVSAVCAGAAANAAQVVAPGGWWLNSQFGVASTGAAVALVAFVLTLVGSAATRTQWYRLGGLWTGAIVGVTVRLFVIGPGTIFPIVIAFGTPILVGAIAVGWACGFVLREWRDGRLK